MFICLLSLQGTRTHILYAYKQTLSSGPGRVGSKCGHERVCLTNRLNNGRALPAPEREWHIFLPIYIIKPFPTSLQRTIREWKKRVYISYAYICNRIYVMWVACGWACLFVLWCACVRFDNAAVATTPPAIWLCHGRARVDSIAEAGRRRVKGAE